MNETCQNWSTLVGRILIGAVFLMAGVQKITGFEGTAGYMASVGLPMVSFLLVLVILLEVVGGLFMILGFQFKISALLLAGFTVLATLIFHNPSNPDQMMFFLKNTMIIGGLLIASSHGAGNLSLDKKLSN